MPARSGGLVPVLSNDSTDINTNYVADGLAPVSLSSNRQPVSRLVFSDRNRVQSYHVTTQPYCGMTSKLEKQKLKHLSALSDGCLTEKKRMKLLKFLTRDLSALSTFLEGADVSFTRQVRAEILPGCRECADEAIRTSQKRSAMRKKQLKAQKKALKLAEKQRKNKGCCEDSPFSSCSSDHGSEMVDMALLHPTEQMGRVLEAPEPYQSVLVENPPNVAEVNGDEKALHVEFAETSDKLGLNLGVGIPVQEAKSVIKVCMGGKCKKSGSKMLLEAFEEKISKSGMCCEVETVG